jgi:hypothetical protein
MNDKVKFKATVRKYLNTHTFYTADDFFCVMMTIIVFF